ncbi:hypothetical protein [Hymenobacter fodinae]|uniref:Phage minor structural protein GP20 n=1 Tax=Hymenobacter fodinae TaxID=2510796 RepID=A0A4Z0P0G4_9BACT|nr:hypothetical protein [Hymenobacter fodinae]TGE04635.1 hypothetical protein EU556_20840 [Hymenobacter fodinae]
MKLKSVIDTLDGVDEALKAAYTEKDGKFYLNVEGIDSHPEVVGLKKSLTTVRDEKKAADARAAAAEDRLAGLPDDFTVEEYNRLKDGGSGNVDQRLADQRARLEDAHKKSLDKVTGERDGLKAKLDRQYSDAALNAAIADAGIAAPFAPAVRAMLKEKVKVDYEGDEAIVTIENMPVTDHLKAWAGTEMGKHYVAAPGNGGGGSGGPGGAPHSNKDNPWSKEGFNLTKQTEIEISDPGKAAQLKAAAGK